MTQVVEVHPWQPWLPPDAKVLFMGTFPPGEHRWSIDFYYPNPNNDFWRILPWVFTGRKDVLYDAGKRAFDLDAIKKFTCLHGIALSDTVLRAIRLKGTASDKDLHVVEQNRLSGLLAQLPACTDVATTGMKAAEILAQQTATPVPAMGAHVVFALPDGRSVRLWRLPSTSRAYPMAFEKKAAYYQKLFDYEKD